jgi:chlorobactene glucosyltransferase
MSEWIAYALLSAALLPFGITVVNLLSWPRGRAGAPSDRTVSVLVPARNEAARIEACVRSIARSRQPLLEIVVCDDQSTDGTAARLDALRREIPSLRVIRGSAPPPGWVGKPHACQQLAETARGDVFVFVDADVVLEPTGLERLLSFMAPTERAPAALVTAVPQQRMHGFAERLMMPLLMLTYTSWLPLRLVSASSDPRFVAANGQLLAITRACFVRLSGFAAIAHEIVDDVALCRHAKRRGERVVFADGTHMAGCRMYESFGGIWRGFSKNLYEGIGGRLPALVLVVLLHLWMFVLPYVVLGWALVDAGAFSQAVLSAAALGVGANVALRALLVLRWRQPPEGVLLHPVAVLALCAIAVNSYRWSRRGLLQWAGREYASRADRCSRITVTP